MPSLALALLVVAGCGGRPPAEYRVSDQELSAVVRWNREYAELLHGQLARLDALASPDLTRSYEEQAADVQGQAAELAKSHAEKMKALLARKPLTGVKEELVTEATGGLYHVERKPNQLPRFVLARDEERIGAARRRFGAPAVDAILAREALVLASVGAASAEPGAVKVPPAAELDAYVSGAGSVHLGMTESEVSDALGAKPTRRQDPTSPGAPSEALWERTGGATPGAAKAQFQDGRLARIEYWRTGRPEPPPVDRASIQPLLTGETAQRSYLRTLALSDIEAVTGGPGHRLTWAIHRGGNGKTTVTSRWIWGVEPGKVLLVDEEDGLAGQPVVRDMR